MYVAHNNALPLSQPHAGRQFTCSGMHASCSLAALGNVVPSKSAWLVLTCSLPSWMALQGGHTCLCWSRRAAAWEGHQCLLREPAADSERPVYACVGAQAFHSSQALG